MSKCSRSRFVIMEYSLDRHSTPDATLLLRRRLSLIRRSVSFISCREWSRTFSVSATSRRLLSRALRVSSCCARIGVSRRPFMQTITPDAPARQHRSGILCYMIPQTVREPLGSPAPLRSAPSAIICRNGQVPARCEPPAPLNSNASPSPSRSSGSFCFQVGSGMHQSVRPARGRSILRRSDAAEPVICS
jgi:hypothetical protein